MKAAVALHSLAMHVDASCPGFSGLLKILLPRTVAVQTLIKTKDLETMSTIGILPTSCPTGASTGLASEVAHVAGVCCRWLYSSQLLYPVFRGGMS